jgi:diguanylate cyclase (GGDEF)-like protein
VSTPFAALGGSADRSINTILSPTQHDGDEVVPVSPNHAKSYTARLLAPIAIVLILASALIAGLLLWSANEVDRIARERDRAIVSLVLAQSIDRVAYDQEASTVWDESVRQLAKVPLDLDWIDNNLGIWLGSYYGHDEVYILRSDGTPVYAMNGGKRVGPSHYARIRPVVRRLIADLRRAGAAPPPRAREVAMLSPGAADLTMVHGRPAIVSVKPVVSDTGTLVQRPGSEALHVSVAFLDAGFVDRLNGQYALHGGRFSFFDTPLRGEASVPLRKHDGSPVGYFIWRPFAPGAEVTASVAPVLLAALVLAALAMVLLARHLGRKTLDLAASEAHAQHLALHDALTGLPNRAMFEQRLDAALARCKRDGSRLALLYVDLDRFKQVNDTLGHPAGDVLIGEVARRLLAQVRPYDTVARIGGDEFAIIQVASENQAATEAMAARIVEDLGRPFDLTGAQSHIGASVGIALAPADGLDRTELCRKADIALYKAKLGGRARHAQVCPAMDEAIRTRETIDRDLRKAIADPDRQLKVHYQPVFSTVTGAMTGVEALLRWDHPEQGTIAPAAFIGFAEESGLIELLGEWVLRRAMRDAGDWPGIRLSVNVSPIQIRNRRFAAGVMELLQETGFDPARLELEITETALMDGSSEVDRTLARLRTRGVGIALDDFGTGYSSLSHIRDIAVDRIKIDRSFVTAIDTGHGAALVQAIVTLAHANGLHLTAEGVETRHQHEFLESIGCEELQGYLLSRPVTADEITARLVGGGEVPRRSRAA